MQYDRTSRRLPRPLLTEKGLILSLFALYILATSAITVLSFNTSQAQQLATTRSMLLTAARAGGHIVGKYFHDTYRQSSPPGQDHYRLLVEALDSLVDDLPGVEYVYSMDVIEGEAYFVISNETQEDLERGTPSRFYNPYQSAPDELYTAYRNREPVFTPVYSNEWGSFRSAFVPTKRFDDTYYIMAADIKVDGRRDLFMHSLGTAATISLIALLPVYLLFLFYRRLQRLRAEELERQLYSNALTGLPNTAWLTREEGETLSGVSGILLNLNNFHAINMLFGREAGDQLIQRIAPRLQEQLPQGAQLYHLEVDEFLVVCQVAEPDTLLSLARQLLAAVFSPSDESTSARFSVSARAGVASGCDSIKSLLSRTQQAMKQASVMGLPYRAYTGTDSPDQYYERNLHWLNEAGQALAEGRLKPWFQPIRDIHSGGVKHYEALARLVGRDGEVYLPGQFLPAIRCSHLYPLLTRSMIEQSLASFRDRDEMVAINMSKQDLLDEQTMAYLFDTLHAYGMEGRVLIEVLESDSIEYQDDVVDVLSRCRQMGVKVAIDDFGSGYSNFDRILKIEPDYLKIDGSLIRRIDEDEASRVLVAAICQFAVSLNIPLIAEFVESERLLPLLEEMGVSLAQGFGIGRPAPLMSGSETEPV
ncbi:EAL domain-containing protein [Marinobacterium stanieri]|uniref:EAL domain-containing protein n=1 Tax=Marinobacterium stanieri TaxID=49186 RepID=UPI0009DAE2E7|nr:bifunctional diguanylate cyclase/phosphodiesterase [Marinobacterium stanieri]